MPLPRVVWFYWRQGYDAAPPVVQQCHRSWVEANPGWDVRFLDAGAESRYVDMPDWAGRLTPQQYSDVLRLRLLARHGGVWTDATTYCNTPLEDWLPAVLPTGFFAFDRPNAGQSLDSWFLAAAQPDLPIVIRTLAFLEQYFPTAPPGDSGGLHTVVRKLVYRVLSRSVRTSEWWFARPVRVGLRLVPYYAIHYAFNRVIRVDPAARETWRGTPKISADGPHLFWKYGLDRAPDDALVAELANPTAPLYKLSWKSAAVDDPHTAVGRFLADRRGAR